MDFQAHLSNSWLLATALKVAQYLDHSQLVLMLDLCLKFDATF